MRLTDAKARSLPRQAGSDTPDQSTEDHQPADRRAEGPFSRRGVLAGLAAGGVAAAVSASSASADTDGLDDGTAKIDAKLYLPRTRAYPKTPMPDPATRHMASRFAYGYTPALRTAIHKAGGPQKWFARQLHPETIPDAYADSFDDWFPTRHRAPKPSFDLADGGMAGQYVWIATSNQGRWHLLRRTYSNRQVQEVMLEFWLNHLHVCASADLQWLYRTSYDKLIRTHALGRFDEMLKAAIVHPTMLLYLDADLSQMDRARTGDLMLNENLGREVLELHTVGRDAGYTEDEVKDSAKLLTGYFVDRFKSWDYGYDPDRHYTGAINVMGFSDANSARDGRPALQRYLTYLAHHPATAQRIARKLAVRFVSDSPSQGLVDHLAGVFRSSGTDIKKTLLALVNHPEFKASAGKKVKTPTEDVVSTFRSYGIKVKRPQRDADAANAIYYICRTVGQVPFGWGPPNGFPDNAGVWTSAARMMGSYHAHYSLAGGFWPNTGVDYRSRASWLPQKRIRFDQFVDHLCRVLHGRGSTSLILGAACLATDRKPGDIITASHPLIQYRLPKLLGILLDTPQFLTR